MNTLLLTVTITVGHIIFASLAAYIMAKRDFPGNKLLMSIVMLSLMFPADVTAIPNYIIISKLTLIDTVDALPGFFDQSTAAAIRIDGEYLYVSNRGADTIARLKINDDGSLKLIRNFPCGGRSPRDFIIADGYILCTNELTNNVSLLKVTEDDLELCGSTIRMPHPISVCALDI
jgi:6-phosphogluconolactonase (cycloisomerase 2 family)